MMNKIKFRVWDKVNNIMLQLDNENKEELIDLFENAVDLMGLGFQYYPNTEWMLSTGLKDKKFKEIYEGDICETVTYSGRPFGTIDVVKFSGGAFKLTDIEDALLPIPLDDSDIQSVEVIGNIFEHPHLIGGKHG